jgi:hypothetical protein
MIVIWRGYGYIALFFAILPVAMCAGLMDVSSGVAFLAVGLSMVVAGVSCLVINVKLKIAAAARAAALRAQRDEDNEFLAGGINEDEEVHSLYFIPLSVWGWFYLALGLFLAIGMTYALIRKGWRG